MTAERAEVQAVITAFLERIGKAGDGLSPETGLWGDGLGLDSLEAAELSAMLEDEFGADPFASGDLPRTVGDVFGYYEALSQA
jgi:acyl carrier protein